MKTRSQNSSLRAIALVLVLGFLVIISALVVAFFTSVTTELRAARTFASGVSTRQLADSTVNVVESQIRQATNVNPADATTQNIAWASQPGMIRTYGDGSGNASANGLKCYKLYSSDIMTVSPSGAASDYDKSWDASPAFYTDLNSPTLVADPTNPGVTVPRFPIIDPRAQDNMDPESNIIEGFGYTSAAVNQIQTVGDVAGTPSLQRLPMPVKWIYVLKDGTMTSPTPGTGLTASFSTNPPTKANPIVGRIAFWSDDDTSKLNINTAGGSSYIPALKDTAFKKFTPDIYAGSYWDTPRVCSIFDQGWVYGQGGPNISQGWTPGAGGNGGQPVDATGGSGPFAGLASVQMLQDEFQRYPGHPATTSLGMVFKNMLTSEQIYDIAPRLQRDTGSTTQSTSMGGTHRLHIEQTGVVDASTQGQVANSAIPIKYDRLYDSVDELLFAPQRNTAGGQRRTNINKVGLDASGPLAGGYTKTNFSLITPDSNNIYPLTPAQLDRVRFFLTAYNRSPELNLFGFPRVNVWPIRSQSSAEDIGVTTGLTAYDSLSLFCSTIGPLIVTGSSSDFNSAAQFSGTNPFRYSFFRREPPKVASGSATGTSLINVSQDIDLARNKQLMQYLQKLTALKIPGFGNQSFQTKFGANNMDELLVEIFDYIRCANLFDTTTLYTNNKNPYPFSYTGIVMPSVCSYLDSNKQNGMGRFPIINAATLIFYYTGSDGKVTPRTLPTMRHMRAALVFSTFNPMQGYGPVQAPRTDKSGFIDPLITFEVSGQSKLTVSKGNVAASGNLFTTDPATITMSAFSGNTWGGRNFGGFEGFVHTLVNNGQAYPLVSTADINVAVGPLKKYDTSNSNTIDRREKATPTFQFSGGAIKVLVKFGGMTVQTVNLNFPKPKNPWPAPLGDDWIDGEPNLPNATDKDSNGYPYGPLRRWYWSQEYGSLDANATRGTPPNNWNAKDANMKPAFTRIWPTGWSKQPAGTKPATVWDFQNRIAWTLGGSSANPETLPPTYTTIVNWYGGRWRQIIQPGDTVRSLIFCNAETQAPANGPTTGGTAKQTATTTSGDLRLAALTNTIQPAPVASGIAYYKHPDYDNGSMRQACMLRQADGNLYYNYYNSGVDKYFYTVGNDNYNGQQEYRTYSPGTSRDFNPFGNHVLCTRADIPASIAMGNLPSGIGQVVRLDKKPGDFDTGVGSYPDGPYFNKQDEGNSAFVYKNYWTGQLTYPVPYYGDGSYSQPGNAFTSPNRQMPSPAMIGSLPSRAATGNSWETLCLSPYPAGANHPGNQGTKDHLILDLLQMPVVQPYPISEPFSTAGKVNLNYAIQPFDYITRTTAVRAVLGSERVTYFGADTSVQSQTSPTATPTKNIYMSGAYKNQSLGQMTTNVRHPIDRTETMKAIETYRTSAAGNNNGLFRAASQICEIPLVPSGWTAANAAAKMATDGSLTGDNVREKPYADIFPRLTTKSNTYTIHMRVQTLQQMMHPDDTGYKTWDESKDAVLAEYRGASTIERYIDPSDRRFNANDPITTTKGDAANPDSTLPQNSLETLYRFRTITTKRFSP